MESRNDKCSAPVKRRGTVTPSSRSFGRFCLGIFLLLLVVVIDSGSIILTKYVFTNLDYDKPYLSTYWKISMFSTYLIGFLVIKSWRKKCLRCACDDYPGQYAMIGETDTDTDDGIDYRFYQSLSQPSYVPTKCPSDLESDAERRKVVQFNEVMEVRHLEDTSAARIARMPHLAALRAKLLLLHSSRTLTVGRIARLSCVFALVFFAGNVAYAEALSNTDTSVVDVLSSTSSIFTLILSSIFPYDDRDKISICKIFAVLLCIAGTILVCIAGGGNLSSTFEAGALWAIFGAVCYAVYIVLLRKIAGGNLNIPMFFAFVGVFTFLLLWPGMLILHYTRVETFKLPTKDIAISLVIHGLIGTVLAETLWLWGCFLTTPLIGTMALNLKIPITVAVFIVVRKIPFSWRYFVGIIPVCFSFLFIAILSFHDDTHSCCATSHKRRSRAFSEQEIPLTAIGSQSDNTIVTDS